MADIQVLSQLNLPVPPTQDNNVVRLIDLEEALKGRMKMPVRVVQVNNMAATYAASPDFTLTASAAVVLPAIDGVTLSVDDRVLLTGQTDKTQNGIYVVTDLGTDGTDPWVLTRADDFNSSSQIFDGVRVAVGQGTTNHDTLWVLTTDDPITLDTTNLDFALDTGRQPSIVEREYDIVGDGATTLFTFTHNLGSLDATGEIFNKTTGATVLVDFRRTSTNDVAVEFALPPAIGEDYRLIVRIQVTP